jgi:NAD(P)-dependent dehydrogenase (short-subunit alcohol dehydrogenase family)
MTVSANSTALIVGASRGLGLGLARELLNRGGHVIATLRSPDNKDIAALAGEFKGKIEIERIDITKPAEIASLRQRLDGRQLDLLFVNAGISNDRSQTIGAVPTEDFTRVMATNALGPMRVIETLQDLVRPDGTIAVMSSILGSVGANESGGWEVYRASKAALNTLMRSYAARHRAGRRTLLAIAPGWVRTDMGGATAPLDVATSMRGVVDTIEARHGTPGMFYVDYRNAIVPW